jgi:hypothetical protein
MYYQSSCESDKMKMKNVITEGLLSILFQGQYIWVPMISRDNFSLNIPVSFKTRSFIKNSQVSAKEALRPIFQGLTVRLMNRTIISTCHDDGFQSNPDFRQFFQEPKYFMVKLELLAISIYMCLKDDNLSETRLNSTIEKSIRISMCAFFDLPASYANTPTTNVHSRKAYLENLRILPFDERTHGYDYDLRAQEAFLRDNQHLAHYPEYSRLPKNLTRETLAILAKKIKNICSK